jgi:hypothetical protein
LFKCVSGQLHLDPSTVPPFGVATVVRQFDQVKCEPSILAVNYGTTMFRATHILAGRKCHVTEHSRRGTERLLRTCVRGIIWI